MAVFMLNICKFNSCGLTFGTLGHLIQHIEETHIDNDPQVLERQERAQPACVPLSYVLRFLTDAARRENALTAVAAQQASKALSVSSLGSSSTSSCLSSASYAASGTLGNPQQLQQPQTQHLLLQQQLQQPSQLHAQQQQQPPQRMVKTLVPASGISNATAGTSDDDEDDADNNEDDDDDDEDDEDMIECDDEDDDDDEEDDEVEDCASNDSWITARSNFERSVEQRQHFQHNDYTSSSMRYNPTVAKNNYKYQQHLQQNQTIKDDSRPFACPVPGCKKRYKNVNGIKYHTKNGHKNDKLLVTNLQHQKLQQHLINKASQARNHSNVSSHFHNSANNNSSNKLFKCGCGKSYKTPYGLKNHMAVRHNIVQDQNKSSYHYSQTLVTNNSIPSAIQDHGYIKQQEPQGLECDANLGVLTPAPSPGSLNHHIKYSDMTS
ncbi:hypothetical protein TKK_0012909 [Trichogramma kaykai]|uniref:C2H2-type domain-containing protein n=1 Tax=Trichogramma kaykai TaxID=54128 RepID=A0ABD2WM56_9HYME